MHDKSFDFQRIQNVIYFLVIFLDFYYTRAWQTGGFLVSPVQYHINARAMCCIFHQVNYTSLSQERYLSDIIYCR